MEKSATTYAGVPSVAGMIFIVMCIIAGWKLVS